MPSDQKELQATFRDDIKVTLRIDRNALRGYFRDCATDLRRGSKETVAVTAAKSSREGENQILEVTSIRRMGASVSPEDVHRFYTIHDDKLKARMLDGSVIQIKTLTDNARDLFYPYGAYNGITHSHPATDDRSYTLNEQSEADITTTAALTRKLWDMKKEGTYSLMSFVLPVSLDVNPITYLFFFRVYLPNLDYESDNNKSLITFPWHLNKIADSLRRNLPTGNTHEALKQIGKVWKAMKADGLVKPDKISGSDQGLILKWMENTDTYWHLAENDMVDDTEYDLKLRRRKRIFDPLIFSYSESEGDVIFRPAELQFTGRPFYYPEVELLKKDFFAKIKIDPKTAARKPVCFLPNFKFVDFEKHPVSKLHFAGELASTDPISSYWNSFTKLPEMLEES